MKEAESPLPALLSVPSVPLWLKNSGTVALVTPQNWLFLGTYKKLRQRLLEQVQWEAVARLGEHAFDSSSAAGAFDALLACTRRAPDAAHAFAGLDASRRFESGGRH